MTTQSTTCSTLPAPTPGREERMVREELWREVHRLFTVERWAKAAIGRELDLDVKTVRRCLRQATWRFGPRTDGVRLDYTVGLVPVELEGGTVVADPLLGERKRTVYGAGVDPVGLFALLGHGPLRLFASARGGVRLFAQAVPNPRGIRFDFTADFALGLAQRVGSRVWISAGPEFHHLSNGGLGDFNPSLNYLAVHLGVLVTAPGARSRPGR